VYRNAGRAGQIHSRIGTKMRRLNLGSIGSAGSGCSLATDPDAAAAAMASLAAMPVQPAPSKPSKAVGLDNPAGRRRAERYANHLLGEKPISSETPMIKRPRFGKEKRRR
jgi:hypothetical protein